MRWSREREQRGGGDDESEDVASASDNDSVASEAEQGEGAEEGGDGSEEEEEDEEEAGAGEGGAATASTVPDGPVTTLDINNATVEQLAQTLALQSARPNKPDIALANRIVTERDCRDFTDHKDMRSRIGPPGLQSGQARDAKFNALCKASPLCSPREVARLSPMNAPGRSSTVAAETDAEDDDSRDDSAQENATGAGDETEPDSGGDKDKDRALTRKRQRTKDAEGEGEAGESDEADR